MMMGAIIGDIAGSRFEWHNIKTKKFMVIDPRMCFFTDDTVATLAVADALLKSGKDLNKLSFEVVNSLQRLGRKLPDAGWGSMFYEWLFSDDPQPYNSFGNGAAMRVSPVAWAADSLDECIAMSKVVTEVSHNHPEGIKGAEAIAVATYMAIHGSTKAEIKSKMQEYYNLDFTLDEIRPTYSFDESCQGTVPQAIVAFLESDGFEDALRNAISIGGDSDTLAACTGAIAEPFYGGWSLYSDQMFGETIRWFFRKRYDENILYDFEEIGLSFDDRFRNRYANAIRERYRRYIRTTKRI